MSHVVGDIGQSLLTTFDDDGSNGIDDDDFDDYDSSGDGNDI